MVVTTFRRVVTSESEGGVVNWEGHTVGFRGAANILFPDLREVTQGFTFLIILLTAPICFTYFLYKDNFSQFKNVFRSSYLLGVCKEDFKNSQRGGSLHLERFRAVNIDVTLEWFTVHESGRSLRVAAHNLHTSSSIRHSDFQVRPLPSRSFLPLC